MRIKAVKPLQISEFHNRSGTLSWRVSGTLSGRRIRQNFATREEAMATKIEIESAHGKFVYAQTPRLTRLTEAQLAEAEESFGRIGTRSLRFVVDHFLATWRDPAEPVPVELVAEKFFEEKKGANLRARTLSTLKARVRRFVSKRAGQDIASITADEVRGELVRPGVAPATVIGDLRAVGSFFAWAKKRKFVAENVVSEIEKPRRDQGEPEILTVDQCRALLDAARHRDRGVLLPYVVLGLFCGVRPAEIARLEWRHINLDDATVTVGGKIAKLRSRRVVHVSENAVAWLRLVPNKNGSVAPTNLRRRLDAARVVAAIDHWPPDVLRHTAITHHLVAHSDENKTAAWAGNSPAVIHAHYKGLANGWDAERFWRILP